MNTRHSQPRFPPAPLLKLLKLLKQKPWLWIIVAIIFGTIVGWTLQPVLHEQKEQHQHKAGAPEQQKLIPVLSNTELIHQYEEDIHPLLEQYCYDCHMDGSDKGDLDLDTFTDLASMRNHQKTWEHILARIDYHLMPPPNKKQPDRKTRDKIISWINHAVFPVDPNKKHTGKRIVRRLNRIEYTNTIRDLLGVEMNAPDILPPDDSGYGFDNIGSVLSVSPSHIEKYLNAAELALQQAIVLGPMSAPARSLELTRFRGGGSKRPDRIFFTIAGTAHLPVNIKETGTYTLHVKASASQAGNEFAKLDVRLNNQLIKTHQVKDGFRDIKTFSTTLKLQQGKQKLGISFPNDFYDPKNPNPQRRDRNLLIHSISLQGPLGKTYPKPETHRNIFVYREKNIPDTQYARTVLSQFAKRAFRRPLHTGEIERYLKLVQHRRDTGEHLDSAIFTAIQAMLVSPSFLYIAPPELHQHGDTQLISEHALASRLSYFLWSSMPNKQLTTLADQGKLRQQLDREITRMLKDTRSKEMIRHFSGQWLQLRDLDVISPDHKKFRNFTQALAQDMRTETEMLCDHIIRGNLSLLEFMNSDYTFINERLANHYSIPEIRGSDFRKVSLTGTPRRGLLTHASILTITSQPTRTSPVLRGKYVLENILDITPPPPPPNLPELEDAENHSSHQSLRQQLETHRKKPACAGCHNLMDPIGLAFQHYNAIGQFRTQEKGQPINASGQLVTGEKIQDAESLRKILANHKKDEFIRCLCTKLMTYAYGRGISRQDRHNITNILHEVKKSDYHAHSLIRAIIHSAPFQYQ